MDALKKERIALEVIKTLKSRFDNFPEDASDNRNAPFHEAFLEAFKVKIENHVTDIPIFVSLASWMHGLNTSIGQSFFEKVSQILCDGEKRKFENLTLSKDQQSTISDIVASLKNKTRLPNLPEENKEAICRAFGWLRMMQYGEENTYFVPEERKLRVSGGFRHDALNQEVWSDASSHVLIGGARLLHWLKTDDENMVF